MWLPDGWSDYPSWQETDRKTLRRVNELIRDSLRSPFSGIGTPEPLKGNLRGWWSRRITEEHHLVIESRETSSSLCSVVSITELG
jgi:toxin YoeB